MPFSNGVGVGLEQMWSPPMIETILLLIAAMSVHISLSPPNPAVKTEECCTGTEGTDTIFEKFVQSITWCSKCVVWACTLCNIIALAARSLFLHGSVPMDRTISLAAWNESVHPIMLIGAASVVVAAALRVWCFKSLGPFFTFEITIRPKHELITHGPYAWVRHPSYTGVYLTLIGATLVLGTPGTCVAECVVRTPLGLLAACAWLLKCGFAFRGMCIRLKAEDDVLRETFGTEWEDYAARVPCKFIPGVM